MFFIICFIAHRINHFTENLIFLIEDFLLPYFFVTMQDSLFELHITEDKLLCYLIYHGKPYDTLHQEQIFYLLNEKKIVFGIQKEKILEILQTIKTSKEFLKIKEIIAKGIPAEESRDGSYKLLISLEPIIPQKSDGFIDYKNIEYY